MFRLKDYICISIHPNVLNYKTGNKFIMTNLSYFLIPMSLSCWSTLHIPNLQLIMAITAYKITENC